MPKVEIQKLEQAYKTAANIDSEPSEMVAAIGVILATYRETKRSATRELRTMIRKVVKLTAAGKATDEQRELIDVWRTTTIEISGKIADLESALYLHQQLARQS